MLSPRSCKQFLPSDMACMAVVYRTASSFCDNDHRLAFDFMGLSGFSKLLGIIDVIVVGSSALFPHLQAQVAQGAHIPGSSGSL